MESGMGKVTMWAECGAAVPSMGVKVKVPVPDYDPSKGIWNDELARDAVVQEFLANPEKYGLKDTEEEICQYTTLISVYWFPVEE